MDFNIETKISNFIRNQFPSFYNEEGENFILFMKAYYEWIESENNPVYHSRNLLNYGDVDNTLEEFLEYFQRKYLYGIPFEVIVNKRFLVKHILDVYRSKGSIQCYKLLFRMIYNEDVEVYLPGVDILRASDGTWIEPRYLEVTDNGNIEDFIGNEIVGTYSGTRAVVENITKETLYRDIINKLFITNIYPKDSNFTIGERIVLFGNESNTSIINQAPILLGSLDTLEVVIGGQDFNVGNIIKIAQRDVSNNQIQTFGVNGILRVSNVGKSFGSINFNILSGGFGFTTNSNVFIYNEPSDTTGNGASFDVGVISNARTIEYNTDIICDYSNLSIDTTSYGFPLNASGNQTSTIGDCFSYESQIFGSIITLDNILSGNSYTQPVDIFVRSMLTSNSLEGSVSYDNTSNTVTGTNTIFDYIYSNNDVICLQSNSSLSSTQEFLVIKEVVSNTQITLYGPPINNSTASALYKASPTILPANFALYEDEMITANGSINGENENIEGLNSTGNNSITTLKIVDSGKGYIESQTVKAYLYNGLNPLTILSGGSGYTNNDLIIFSGGGTTAQANGFVTTDANGTITSTSLVSSGSGYDFIPNISVKTSNGSGASFTTTLKEFNTVTTVIGTIKKKGIGVGKGYWSTSRGFLNSDKYIQDSYYYQDYSYELRVARTLSKYKDFIYNTFHPSGSELFGKYLRINTISSNNDLVFSSNTSEYSAVVTSDSDLFTSDTTRITVDNFTYLPSNTVSGFLTVDIDYITSDSMFPQIDYVP